MMADSNFNDAERSCDALLKSTHTRGADLLELYGEILSAQNKKIPASLLLELVELKWAQDLDGAATLIKGLNADELRTHFVSAQQLRIRIALGRGMSEEVYELISEFLLRQYEFRVPVVPVFILELIEKFFSRDFRIKLKLLSLDLQVGEVAVIEARIREIISLCFEKPSIRGVKKKFELLAAVIEDSIDLGPMPVYQNFCALMSHGFTSKSDFKRLAEIVIYFDDFQFKSHVLALLREVGLLNVCTVYAQDLRSTENYDFVYLDKFHPALKAYFVSADPGTPTPEPDVSPVLDLRLQDPVALSQGEPYLSDDQLDEEFGLISVFKYQTYSCADLVEISTSLIQSQFFRAARTAAELAMQSAPDQAMLLRASYLKLTALLHLRDFRAALDLSLESMSLAESQDDILAFLYAQAEAYQFLGDLGRARKTLRKILSIDAAYRLAQEKLGKLA